MAVYFYLWQNNRTLYLSGLAVGGFESLPLLRPLIYIMNNFSVSRSLIYTFDKRRGRI